MSITTSQNAPILVTMDEAAKMLSVSRSTVYRLGRRGQIKVVPIGSKNLISVQSLHDLLKSADDSSA